MDEQDGLFSFGSPSPEPALIERMLATPGQVQSIRSTLDEAGIHTQEERQQVLEKYAGRPLASLRDLYADEVNELRRRLLQRGESSTHRGGSAWDNREEDTWIDRM